MSRAVAMHCLCACLLAACGGDELAPGPSDPPPNDAQITPVLDARPPEEHVTSPNDPRDAAITEPTPILDLPLVIARPSAPLSTASIDVVVLDPEGAPVADISVSTGGPAVLTNAFGLARVTAVYGRDFSDLYAFGALHTLTHARIPIRAGEASQAALIVTPIVGARLEDSAMGGVVETEQLQVTFAEWSLELPWGGKANGPSVVSATVLAAPEEAASVPGGMLARIGGELVPVAGLASFELRVAQGTTELSLLGDASVQFSWSGAVPGLGSAELMLYFFDAKEGALVPRGTLDRGDAAGLVATIDRLGHWVIGSHAAPVHCARVEVHSEGTPLPRAGMVLTRAGAFSAARVEADASGSGCALMPLGGELRALALGKLGGRLFTAQGAVAASAEPAMCDDACAPTVLQGESLALGCVTGQLSIPRLGEFGTTVNVTDAFGTSSVALLANDAFCIDVRAGAHVELASTTTDTCTSGGVLTMSASIVAGASCGDNPGACQDVGTIQCCAEQESCSTPSGDDDCDGVTDEGCSCAGADCSWTTSVDRCCAADGRCGERATFTGECVGLEGFGIPIGCPSANVPSAEGGTTLATGCCRSNGECGLMWGTRGCVAAADVSRVWGPTVTLSSVACMP